MAMAATTRTATQTTPTILSLKAWTTATVSEVPLTKGVAGGVVVSVSEHAVLAGAAPNAAVHVSVAGMPGVANASQARTYA